MNPTRAITLRTQVSRINLKRSESRTPVNESHKGDSIADAGFEDLITRSESRSPDNESHEGDSIADAGFEDLVQAIRIQNTKQ